MSQRRSSPSGLFSRAEDKVKLSDDVIEEVLPPLRQSVEPYLMLLNGVRLMSSGVLLNNVQRHYGMNFPSCVPGLVTSPV